MTIGTDTLVATQAFTGTDGTTPPAPFVARRGTWAIYSNQLAHAQGEALGTNSCTFNPTRANNNYTVVASHMADLSNGTVKGIMLRRSNGTTTTNNAYLLGVDDSGHAVIWKLANDVETVLIDNGYQASNFDGTFKASVDVSGGNAVLTLTNGAGTSLVTYTDSTSPYLSGDMGFFDNTNNSQIFWDNVSVLGTSAAIALAGAAAGIATAAAALTAAIKLAVAASSVATAAASLTTAPRFAGSATGTATATGALTNWATVTLSGTLYTGTGGVLDPNFWVDDVPTVGTTIYYDGTHITIASNGEISSNQNPTSAVVGFAGPNGWATGLVFFTPYLVGYANDVVTATGGLTTGMRLAASASALASATGLLTGVSAQLGGPALSVATAAAQLLTAIKLQGAATASATASAQFTSTAAQLAGAAQDISTAAGLLSTGIPLDGHAADISAAIGALLTAIKLGGNAVDLSTATGALASTSAQLSAAALDVATAVGLLSTGIPLDGHAAAIVTASAQLSTAITLFGNALAAADATGVVNKLLAAITVRPAYRVPFRRGRYH